MHRVYCVGRNYAAHAIEMGHDPNREPPFFFQKNPDNLMRAGPRLSLSAQDPNVHHEIEMVVALGKGGINIPVGKALDYVFGYGVGLDMTRRDLQGEARSCGGPGRSARPSRHSAPCRRSFPAEKIGHPAKGAIWLKVNGEREAAGRSQPDDLEGAGDDLLSLRAFRAGARRHHHVRHALGRRAGQARRQAARPRRWRRRTRTEGDLNYSAATRAGASSAGHSVTVPFSLSSSIRRSK